MSRESEALRAFAKRYQGLSTALYMDHDVNPPRPIRVSTLALIEAARLERIEAEEESSPA